VTPNLRIATLTRATGKSHVAALQSLRFERLTPDPRQRFSRGKSMITSRGQAMKIAAPAGVAKPLTSRPGLAGADRRLLKDGREARHSG